MPPRGGGVDEARLSVEEKLQRERTRELGLGVTRYEWAAKPPKRGHNRLLVPQPAG